MFSVTLPDYIHAFDVFTELHKLNEKYENTIIPKIDRGE